MPQSNEKLVAKINQCRIASFGAEVKLENNRLFTDGLKSITFKDGEIDSVKWAGKQVIKRSALVNVLKEFKKIVDAVVIGFSFGESVRPIRVSFGGAEGELVYSVNPDCIVFYRTQAQGGDVVTLQVKLESKAE